MEDLMNWASPVPLFGVEDPDRLERMRSFLENYAEAHRLKQTSVSLRFAWKCHEGQFRKSRNRLPYISHPLLMAIHAVTLGLVDDDLLAACLLHDVLEDCPVSREELPCSEAAKDAIELLTFEIAEGEDRDSAKARYYERLSHNGIAAMVKMLDRCNNVSYMVDAFSLKKIQQYVVEQCDQHHRDYAGPFQHAGADRRSAAGPEHSGEVLLIRRRIRNQTEKRKSI